MILQCDDLDRALQSPELMPDARTHAETCRRCAEQLSLWEEISRQAPALHKEWDSPDLWPRIQAELDAMPPKRNVVPIRRWVYAAAAVAAALVATMIILRPAPGTRASNSTFLTDDALNEVQRAEAAYTKSIEKLSAVANASMDQSPSPLAQAYREKLLVLDSAIEECRAAIANNRYNTYLQTQLAGLYKEKQKTLQDWMKNATRN